MKNLLLRVKHLLILLFAVVVGACSKSDDGGGELPDGVYSFVGSMTVVANIDDTDDYQYENAEFSFDTSTNTLVMSCVKLNDNANIPSFKIIVSDMTDLGDDMYWLSDVSGHVEVYSIDDDLKINGVVNISEVEVNLERDSIQVAFVFYYPDVKYQIEYNGIAQ